MFLGQTLRVDRLEHGIADVCFDRVDADENKFDFATVEEFRDVTQLLRAGVLAGKITGVLVTSAKSTFMGGSDIFELQGLFAKSPVEIAEFTARQAAVFSAFEDLPVPTLAAINGLALGGGFEMSLAADFRVLSENGQVGLPDVSLGLFPCFGATVRLPRRIGPAAALDWIVAGTPRCGPDAIACGAVDALAAPDELRIVALALLRAAAAAPVWRDARRRRLGRIEAWESAGVDALRARAAATAARYPAALAVIELVEVCAELGRDDALAREAIAFGHIARDPTAQALIQLFVNEHSLQQRNCEYARAASDLKHVTMLSASLVEFTHIGAVDLLVEAIGDDLATKQTVLAEVERKVPVNTVIVSETSTLSVDAVAATLEHPERFVGIHIPRFTTAKKLVEVIRGKHSCDRAVASAIKYVLAQGRTPVVVGDCRGFLTDRILYAYLIGFCKLLRDGADFEQVDSVMETFGWSMGPAHLLDVGGMDTCAHLFNVIASGHPTRQALDFVTPMQLLSNAQRTGQNAGRGFYGYVPGTDGLLEKHSDPEPHSLLAALQAEGSREFTADQIVDRMMIPTILEAAACLEERIIQSPADIDMALVLGVGFPPHRGGLLAYADSVGLQSIVRKCEGYVHLGAGYRPSPVFRDLAMAGREFYTR